MGKYSIFCVTLEDEYGAPRGLISTGSLHWVSADFCEQLSHGAHLRPSLFELGRIEQNHFAALHLSESYEWVLQGRPRRPPPATRVQTVAMQLLQDEFQEAALRMAQIQHTVYAPRLRIIAFCT